MISKTRAEAFGNTKWIALAILCVTYFLQQGTRQIYNATLPQIKADFLAGGVSDVQLGVIGSVFSLVYGVVVPFAGVAADLFGRKRIVVLALLLFSTGICASGFAGGLGMLLAMYGVLAAVGQCMFPSPATSLIAQLHPKTRATALSIFQASLYLGIVACSCAAGWLGGLGEGGWRKAFWIFGAAGLLWVPAVVFGLKEPPPVSVDGGTDAKPSAGEALLAMVRKPSAVMLTLGFGMCMYGSKAFFTWMPAFFQKTFPSLSPAAAAFHAMFWFYCGAFAGISCASRVTDRLAGGRPGVRMEANILGLALCAPFAFLAARAPSVTLCCAALAFWGFAHGVYDSNFFASLYDVVAPRYRAAATGAFLCGGFVIGSFSPAVLGWMSQHLSIRDGFASLAAFYLAGAAAILVARVAFLKRDLNPQH